MALFGELVLIALGLIILIGGSMSAYAAAAFSGKGGGWILVPITIGSAILWFAIHYGPLTVTVN